MMEEKDLEMIQAILVVLYKKVCEVENKQKGVHSSMSDTKYLQDLVKEASRIRLSNQD
jgi:hypothetical protein